ncbi:DUF1292 domain-containing protein [Cytobacillus firmus]|uniref:DUF1292 domain-containing protein n=1 Tax=Cytobacillus firmus DS1 TaxID=1307436 RepID=W7L1E5_CYTFI|nr:DUF1292 domain-containing protein [Cytobacillus firmus]EWG09351.1 hypothetical protein PBF_19683 [Cytobacillus firmus DS1]
MIQPIGMVLVNEEGETHDDVSLIKLIDVNSKRFAVLQDDEGISFAQLTIDNTGHTCFTDITDEEEFKVVERIYRKSPNE